MKRIPITIHYCDIPESLVDCLTALNFSAQSVLLSSTWFNHIIMYGYLDQCDFDIRVTRSRWFPSQPLILLPK